MLNTNPINTNEINFVSIENIDGDNNSNFSQEFKGKYNFISKTGSIFNFGNIGCNNNNFGNIIINHNFEGLADISTNQYNTSFRNGGIFKSRRFNDFNFEIELELKSDNIENLNNEISLIKKEFNKGGKLYKIINGVETLINVELIDFDIGRILKSGTIIKLSLLSLDPFWIEKNKNTLFYENETEQISGTLTIGDSDISPDLKIIVDVKNTTDVDQLTINLNGYLIIIDETIENNSIIQFDGIKKQVKVNGIKVRFKGQFMPFEIGKPLPFEFLYSGTISEYNLYVLYDKIRL